MIIPTILTPKRRCWLKAHAASTDGCLSWGQWGKSDKRSAGDESVQQLEAALLALSVLAEEVIDKGGNPLDHKLCVV